MSKIAELKFNQNGKTFFYDAQKFELKKDDKVVAIFSDSKEIGTVVKVFEKNLKNQELGEILYVPTKKDFKIFEQSQQKSKDAFPKVLESVKKFNLSMKLVEVKFSFDMTKLFISYISENRVDFRELVKHLASIFKTRVELRQISSREEARLFGGCGSCGKELCCIKFLPDEQVTIKMAKAQNLALNPNKVNGVCGKLKCCIVYEFLDYQKVIEKMPPLGSFVKTSSGVGEVVYQDLLNEKVDVKFVKDEVETIESFDLGDVKLNDKN